MRSSVVHALRQWAVLAVLAGAACGGGDSGPVCADFAGTWSFSPVPWGGVPNLCYGSRVWTLSQTGCNVTVSAPAPDPANGATGHVQGEQLYIEWSWTPSQGGCTLREHVAVTLVGDRMKGNYGITQCTPTYISCAATVDATRQVP